MTTINDQHLEGPTPRGNSLRSLDTHDEDLEWILDRLVHRVGGTFGFLSSYLEGQTTLIALHGRRDGVDDSCLQRLAEAARCIGAAKSPSRDDAPVIGQSPSESWRLLSLSFQPTLNLKIVATVCREDGALPFSAPSVGVATILYPVLSRYVRIWWMHRLQRQRSRALSNALDFAELGVLLLDRRGRIIFDNTHAGRLLERGDGVKRHDQTLKVSDAETAGRLQTAIQQATRQNLATATIKFNSRGNPLIKIPRTRPKRPLLAIVMSVQRSAIDFDDPAVIVYLLDPDQDVRELLDAVCRVNRLSTAQSQLVQHLVGGATVQEAAAKMQIQTSTARAYLKQVFQKTQTNRQAQLVKLMLTSAIRTNAKLDYALI
jgi:DNA-binding CsgD family transcriptional regulator